MPLIWMEVIATWSIITSSIYLKIIQISKKLVIPVLWSSSCNPSNWIEFYSIDITFSLISKLVATIAEFYSSIIHFYMLRNQYYACIFYKVVANFQLKWLLFALGHCKRETRATKLCFQVRTSWEEMSKVDPHSWIAQQTKGYREQETTRWYCHAPTHSQARDNRRINPSGVNNTFFELAQGWQRTWSHL